MKPTKNSQLYVFLKKRFIQLAWASCLVISNPVLAHKHTLPIVLDTSSVTVSGVSSGGYMATQFHLSYPEFVSGVGVISAGPYGCARNSIMTALAECLDKAPDNYPASIMNTAAAFDSSKSNLKDDKVWLFHGSLDNRIVSKVSDALHAQYKQLIQVNNLRYVNDKPFAHLFPTLASGVSCEESASPFIGNCNYDAAGEMLSFIMEKEHSAPLKPRHSKEETMQKGELISLEQGELFSLDNTGMNKEGFAYLPNSCRDGKSCKVHISFHGCNQSVDNIGKQYATNTGINEWAASNRIVVLYPQIEKSSLMPMNPQACWDWWGYTGEEYLNKNGEQNKAVRKMVVNLADYLNK
jgi:poly(3-hydroxybutyrate) depolymerase